MAQEWLLLSLDDAIARASERYMVGRERVLGQSRDAVSSEARRFLWLALYDSGWSLVKIGQATGRNHTSVSRGVLKARTEQEPLPPERGEG